MFNLDSLEGLLRPSRTQQLQSFPDLSKHILLVHVIRSWTVKSFQDASDHHGAPYPQARRTDQEYQDLPLLAIEEVPVRDGTGSVSAGS